MPSLCSLCLLSSSARGRRVSKGADIPTPAFSHLVLLGTVPSPGPRGTDCVPAWPLYWWPGTQWCLMDPNQRLPVAGPPRDQRQILFQTSGRAGMRHRRPRQQLVGWAAGTGPGGSQPRPGLRSAALRSARPPDVPLRTASQREP